MLTVQTLLPTLNDLPGPDPLDLATPVELGSPTFPGLLAAVDAIIAAQRASCQDNIVFRLQEISLQILDDVVRARESIDSLEAEIALDLLAFTTTTPVANATLSTSDGSRAHEWWVRSLSNVYRGEHTYHLQQRRLTLWQVLPGELALHAAETAALWVAGFYLHSWQFGQSIKLADELFTVAAELDVPIKRGWVSELTAARSMMFRAQWALRYRPLDVQPLAAQLEQLIESPRASRETKSQIAMFFALTDSPLTDVPQDQRAVEALDAYADFYGPAERLALLGATCWGRVEDLLNRFDELRAVAQEAHLHRKALHSRPTDELYARSVQYDRIGPAVRVLAEGGHSDEAVELIAAWHGISSKDALKGAVVGLTSSAVNTRWCLGSAIEPMAEPGEDPDSYGDIDAVLSAITAFLSLAFTNASNPELVVIRPERPGIPDLDRAAKFDHTVTNHLRFNGLRKLVKDTQDATALVTVPGIPLPIQPLMLREMDFVLPLSVSLQRSRHCRPLTRAVIIGDSTTTSPWERDIVTSVLGDAGVSVTGIPSITRQDFGELYCNNDIDLLWITSHGDFDPVYPDRSALILSDTDAAEMDWLASLAPSSGDRRLLVLNVCDGGQSASHGGPFGFGLAPVLAGPTQTVISHLWPTAPPVAAAFGVLLSVALANGSDHLEAFAHAVRTLSSGRDQVLEALRATPGDGRRLAQNLAGSSLELGSIAHWGSPTLHV